MPAVRDSDQTLPPLPRTPLDEVFGHPVPIIWPGQKPLFEEEVDDGEASATEDQEAA